MIKFRFDSEPAIQALVQKERAVDSALLQGAAQAAKTVETAARRKVKLARKTNVQDAPTKRRISQTSPVRSLVQGATAFVELRSHQTGARTKPLRGLYAKFGLTRQLERRGLWVAPKGSNLRSKAGYSSRAGLSFFLFAKNPRLAAWSENPQKGSHRYRNTVRLTDPRVRLEITLKPAVDATLGQVRKIYEVRMREALK